MAINFRHTNRGDEMERYHSFYSTSLKREMIDYEYIYTDGSHFKYTADTLEEAREYRDKWLNGKKKS